MAITYTSITGSTIIQKTDDNGIVSYVPADPNNADYQNYLNQQQGGGNGGN